MNTGLVPRSRAPVRSDFLSSAPLLPQTIPSFPSPFPLKRTPLSPELGSVASVQNKQRPGRENAASGQYVPQPHVPEAAQNALRNDIYTYNDFGTMFQRPPQLTAPSPSSGRLPASSTMLFSPTASVTPTPQSQSFHALIDLHNSSSSTPSNSHRAMETINPVISPTTEAPELERYGSHGHQSTPTLYGSRDHQTRGQCAEAAAADKYEDSGRPPNALNRHHVPNTISELAKKKTMASSPGPAGPAKSKRVRTGCLTCRERHLKCDSPLTRPALGVSVPDCFNCRKGNRNCKRGLRLNFIDIQVKPVPYFLPVAEWNVSFVDESRLIASEYVGGARRYPRERDTTPELPLRNAESEWQKLYLHHGVDGQTANAENAASPTPFSTTGHGAQEHTQQQQAIPVQQQDESDMQSMVSKERPQAQSTTIDLSNTHAEDESFSFYVGEAELQDIGWYSRHAAKSSDASSITSSMVAQGVGHSSTSSSQVEVGNSPVASSRSIPKLGSAACVGLCNEGPDGLPTPPSETGRPLRDNAVDDKFNAVGGFEDICGNDTITPTGEREYLDSADEMLFMQAFVQNVGVWMDVLDKEKHFSRIIPFSALKSPMLLNAFLACGVKQLTLVNPTYKDDKALFYYNTATMILSRSLQNPDRNIIECATAAVVLHVYDIMSEKPNTRTNHNTGARALIRECGWNASSKGIGAACFWLNISMELLNCLAYNWPTAWDPDQWGLDLKFTTDNDTGNCCTGQSAKQCANDSSKDPVEQESNEHAPGSDRVLPCRRHSMETSTEPTLTTAADGGDEEVWVQRIFYIVAKIANFRATVPRFQEPSPHDEQMRLQTRISEWKRLKNLCDVWNRRCPRSMRPFGYLFPVPNASTSRFPNIWLVKRAAVVGRLFYHTAMVLLHQVNPIDPYGSAENRKPLHHHAHQVCGIVAHNKDRGVAAVAIRSLAVSAAVLHDPHDQDEVFALFERMSAETGWRIEKIYAELQQSWRRGVMKRSGAATVASTSSPPGAAPPRLPAPADLSPVPASLPPADVFAASKMGPSASILAGHQFAALAPPFKPPCGPTAWSMGRVQAGLAAPAPPGPPPTTVAAAVAPSVVPSGHSSPASATSLSQQRATQMMNPLFQADFRLPDHPYKAFYRPPNDANDFNTQLI